jgi:hypothetical protein
MPLAVALEAFYADHKRYPAAIPMTGSFLSRAELRELSIDQRSVVDPGSATRPGLTTPVAYLTQAVKEPWLADGRPMPYRLEGQAWMLYAAGPDADYDIVPDQPILNAAGTALHDKLFLLQYDPSNGTFSNGDVWTAKWPGSKKMISRW